MNAHPGFLETDSITGMVNEPPARVGPNLKMILTYATFLEDGEPLLTAKGLKQPPGAKAAWRTTIMPPEGEKASAIPLLSALSRDVLELQHDSLC